MGWSFFELFGCGPALGTVKAGPGWSPQGMEQQVPLLQINLQQVLRTPVSHPSLSLHLDKAVVGKVTQVLQAAA